MRTKIAVVSDIHYSSKAVDVGDRHTSIADTLLHKVVSRFNKYIKPDVVLFLGDIIDQGSNPNAVAERQHIQNIIGELKCKSIVIPGNHDEDIDKFYQIFSDPGDFVDINDIRFVIFHDAELPSYNAVRSDEDLEKMRAARREHNGHLIALQHYPFFKPGTGSSPYSLSNADEAWKIFEKESYTLAISGHWHYGEDRAQKEQGSFFIANSLCENDFPYHILEIDGDEITTETHYLKLPSELNLIDYHIHSQYAYCSANMDMATNVKIADAVGLAKMVFTEHSGQLYFSGEDYWGGKAMENGIYTPDQTNRMDDYLRDVKNFCPPAIIGSEIDCDFAGRPVIKPEHLKELQVRLGSIHWIPELRKPEWDMETLIDEWLGLLSKFLPNGIQILGHPLRILGHLEDNVPERLVSGMVKLMRENNTAAEINFHGKQITYPNFVKACVEGGVKIVFGSDSHVLFEIGEFYPHLKLMEECGYSHSDLDQIIAPIVPA